MTNEPEKKNSVDPKLEKPKTPVENSIPLSDETLDDVAGGFTRPTTFE